MKSEGWCQKQQSFCRCLKFLKGSNLTASANDLEWNDRKWSIVNHFIPFTEEQVGSSERFESDFMVRYMEGKTFSEEANAVLAEGLKIWQANFETAYKALTEKLRPKVYEYGFLK